MSNSSSHQTFPVSKTRSSADAFSVTYISLPLGSLIVFSLTAVMLVIVSGCGASSEEVSSSPSSVPALQPSIAGEPIEDVPVEFAREEFTVEPMIEDRPFEASPQPSFAVEAASEQSFAVEAAAAPQPAPIPAPGHAASQRTTRPPAAMKSARSVTQHPTPQSPAPLGIESVPQQTVDVSPENKQPASVEVFYATDRGRIASVSKGNLWSVFGWAFQLGLVALIAGIFGGLYQRQGVKLVAAASCIACSGAKLRRLDRVATASSAER